MIGYVFFGLLWLALAMGATAVICWLCAWAIYVSEDPGE